MSKLAWDQTGEKIYETGVDHGVLYPVDNDGKYPVGVPWNGLTTVTESPSGAESNKQYADNRVYLNLVSAEEFSGTIEAFTYPDEFGVCDGTATPVRGVRIGQQVRRAFGFVWRTLIGNDILGTDYGYKLHLVWNALAAPSEKANATVNESPEAMALSWEFSTTPTEVGGGYKPTASMTVDSTEVSPEKLALLEDILFGTEGEDARLPSPAEVIALLEDEPVEVTLVDPTYNAATKTIALPATVGVEYFVDGTKKTGAVVITKDTVVTARPTAGHVFKKPFDNDWLFRFTA